MLTRVSLRVAFEMTLSEREGRVRSHLHLVAVPVRSGYDRRNEAPCSAFRNRGIRALRPRRVRFVDGNRRKRWNGHRRKRRNGRLWQRDNRRADRVESAAGGGRAFGASSPQRSVER